MNKSGLQLFADLIRELDSSTKTNDKLFALGNYFANAPMPDRVWVIALFSGRRPRRIVGSTQLQIWCAAETGLPDWLLAECYHTVGDLAETIALLMPENTHTHQTLDLSYYIEALQKIEKESEETKRSFIVSQWHQLNKDALFVFNKLITGGFRIGISQKMMVNALAASVQLDPSLIALRISGKWDPVTTSFETLLSNDLQQQDFSKPYPFYLAHALEEEPINLGNINEWQAEWKWDGIRGQLIKRNGEIYVWSRGEELMTDKFPEYASLKNLLPDGIVLDGEIIPTKNKQPLPFALLQTRIGRKNITKKQLEEVPISFFAYDLLEWQHEDIRGWPLEKRAVLLEQIIATANLPERLQLSTPIEANTWEELIAIRNDSRSMFAEGLMLKRKNSIYQVGRKTGDWWKWKIDPLTIDAVMIYAQKGHGRRSNLYTDYTFAVRDGDKLISFTKAYSGLTDKEFIQVDDFVKKNAVEKFGPVRTVKPELVFEIAFEGIAASNRHKSGVALRFPRILRWRKDKTITDINTLEDLKKLLALYGK